MSDRAATEHKFNDLLQEYRRDILPLLVENYDNLSNADRMLLEAMYNFFCGLHSLVHLAECANSGILAAEKGLLDESARVLGSK